MNKGQLIEAIRQFNPTAKESFLARFKEKELAEYLSHLKGAQQQSPVIHGRERKGRKWRMAS